MNTETTTEIQLGLTWEEVVALYEAALSANYQKLKELEALLTPTEQTEEVIELTATILAERKTLDGIISKLYEARRG